MATNFVPQPAGYQSILEMLYPELSSTSGLVNTNFANPVAQVPISGFGTQMPDNLTIPMKGASTSLVGPAGGVNPEQGGGLSALFKGFFGDKENPGWGGTALGALGALGSGYMGMQQLKLGRDTMNENRRQFDLNYGAQRDTLNTQMADRQAARVASNPNAYQSVNDYMAANRIK